MKTRRYVSRTDESSNNQTMSELVALKVLIALEEWN